MLGSAIFGSVANVLLKLGTKKKIVWLSFLTNKHLMLGLLFHGFAAVLGIIAYKWGELSLLFPIGAFSYVLTLLLAKHILHEHMNVYKVAAIVCIIIGIMVTIL